MACLVVNPRHRSRFGSHIAMPDCAIVRAARGHATLGTNLRHQDPLCGPLIVPVIPSGAGAVHGRAHMGADSSILTGYDSARVGARASPLGAE